MVKFFLFALLILSLISCREEEGVWDKLTPSEQTALRARAVTLCRNSNADYYEKFKEKSLKVFSSSDYKREKSFTWTFTKSGGGTDTMKLHVWKQMTSPTKEIYFFVEETKGTGTQKYFLRLTQAQNEEIIDDLLDDHCKKTYSAKAGSGSASITYEYEVPDGDGHKEYTDTYSFDFDELAFFGTFSLKRTQIDVDEDDDETKHSYSSKFEEEDEYNFDDDEPYTFYATKYCDVKETDGLSSYQVRKENKGFNYDGTTSCESGATQPAGWNL